MFGFGKKKNDEKMLGMISIEISMFMRWMETQKNRMLSPDELHDIAERILRREGLKESQEDLDFIVNMSICSDVDDINKMRKQTNFDAKVIGFMNSIQLKI